MGYDTSEQSLPAWDPMSSCLTSFKPIKTEEEAPVSGNADEKETPRYDGLHVVATCFPVVLQAAAASSYQDGDLATQRTVRQEGNTAGRSSAQGERQPRVELGAGGDQGRRRLEPEFEVEAPPRDDVGAPPAGVAITIKTTIEPTTNTTIKITIRAGAQQPAEAAVLQQAEAQQQAEAEAQHVPEEEEEGEEEEEEEEEEEDEEEEEEEHEEDASNTAGSEHGSSVEPGLPHAPQPAENGAIHENGAQAVPSLPPLLQRKLEIMSLKGMLDSLVSAGIIPEEGSSSPDGKRANMPAWRGVAAYLLPNVSLTELTMKKLIDLLKGEPFFNAGDKPRQRWQKLVLAVFKRDSNMEAHIQHQSWHMTSRKKSVKVVLRNHFASQVRVYLQDNPNPEVPQWLDLANKLTGVNPHLPPARLGAPASTTNQP